MSSRHRIETAEQDWDQQALSAMLVPVEGMLPEKFVPRAGADLLGMVEHGKVHEVAAGHAFNSLSYIFAARAHTDAGLRDELIASGSATLPEVRLGDFHSFRLRRYQGADGMYTTYSVERTDIGNPEGGFMVIQNRDGSVVLRRTDVEGDPTRSRGPDEEAPDQATLIAVALSSIGVIAKKFSISTERLRDNMHTDHLSDAAIADFARQAKQEKQILNKAKRIGQIVLDNGVVILDKIFRKHEAASKDNNYQYTRTWRRGRLALAGVALAAGVSQVATGSLVPPAAVSAVTGPFSSSGTEQPAAPSPAELYDEQQIDLPSETGLTPGAGAQSVAVLTELPEGINGVRPLQVGAFGIDALAAVSPRRVHIQENLGPNQCARLPIDQSVQGGDIRFATTDPTITDSISAEAGIDAISICNEGNQLLSADQLNTFVFDA